MFILKKIYNTNQNCEIIPHIRDQYTDFLYRNKNKFLFITSKVLSILQLGFFFFWSYLVIKNYCNKFILAWFIFYCDRLKIKLKNLGRNVVTKSPLQNLKYIQPFYINYFFSK